MANLEHYRILWRGSKVWNRWREENPDIRPDLNEAGLGSADLSGANLRRTNLRYAELIYADLGYADLREADLSGVNLSGARLRKADLSGARLHRANLACADLRGADLSGARLYEANLSPADLRAAKFVGTDFDHAVFSGANLGYTIFCNSDLSTVQGLESVIHRGPSSLGIDTFLKSQGKIPDVFLLGCGIPQDEIPYLRAMSINPIEYNSCFISYSRNDEDFARRLYSGLRDKNLRVWYSPEDIRSGRKVLEQIDQAIQVHDRLLVVLSDHSMASEWVKTEIYKACQREIKEKRRILFPIALVPFKQIKAWEFHDADTGKDLAREIREYYIPNFSNWKEHDSFELEFSKLLRDLRASASEPKTD